MTHEALASGPRTAPSGPLPDLKNLSLSELVEWFATLGEPRFRAGQVFRWLHARGARSFDEMSDVSRATRGLLAARAALGGLTLHDTLQDADGTTKLLLHAGDAAAVESVLIPMPTGLTQCVSTQVGCRMGCRFCLTGQRGLQRQLSAAEIVDQIYAVGRLPAALGLAARPDKLVFMGMGEPLDNLTALLRAIDLLGHDLGLRYSGRRITVSTAGHVPGIERLGAATRGRVGLAVSLNAPSDDVRREIMPIARAYPLDALLAALRRYPLPPRRRITIEYVLLAGINDRPGDAERLVALLNGLRCKVNLIPFNPWPGAPFDRPGDAAVELFRQRLFRSRFVVTVRESRGQRVGAACGLLGGTTPAGEFPPGRA